MYFLLEFYLMFSLVLFFLFGISYSYASILHFPCLDTNLLYITLLISSNSLIVCLNTSILDVTLFNNLIVKNSSSTILFIIIILLNILSLLVTRHYNKQLSIISFEYFFLVLLLNLNSVLLISVNNLFLFFLLVELQSIVLFILSAINRRSRYSIESSLKYFILGSFSSILMLLGIALVYITTSLLFFDDLVIFLTLLGSESTIQTGLSIALVLVSIGFFFKLYSAPFHFWVSDIYQGSASSSVIVFSSSSLFVFFFLFVKFFFMVFYSFFSYYLLGFSILSMFFGTIGGLLQRRLKRVLAYSSITVTGYLFLILCSESVYSLESFFCFLIVYILTSVGVLTIFCNIMLNKSLFVNFTNQLTSLVRSNKIISFVLASFLFSIGGIPPFLGFVAKLEALNSLLLISSYACFFIFLVTSVVSFLYYVRIVKHVYTKHVITWVSFLRFDYTSSVVLVIIFFVSILGLNFNSFLFLICKLVSINIFVY